MLLAQKRNPLTPFAQDAETQSCMQPKSVKGARMAKPGFTMPRVLLRKNLGVSASWREPQQTAYHAVVARSLRAAQI